MPDKAGSQPAFRRADATLEYLSDERCHITELSNFPEDAEVSIARARIEPGVTTAWHRLTGITERYIIVSGRGSAEIGDAGATDVTPGDVVLIPSGTRQRISNSGEDDLVFLCICTPRFEWPLYERLEP